MLLLYNELTTWLFHRSHSIGLDQDKISDGEYKGCLHPSIQTPQSTSKPVQLQLFRLRNRILQLFVVTTQINL